MEILEIFEVREEIDKTGGRGGTKFIGYFLSQDDAEKAAQGLGVWGSAGPIQKRPAISVEGKIWLLADSIPVQVAGSLRDHLIKTAIRKLTQAEREVLGIERLCHTPT